MQNTDLSSLGRGLLFTLPFIIANVFVTQKRQPMAGRLSSISSPIVPLILLLLFPVGAYVMLQPMWRDKTAGRWQKYRPHIIIASIVVIIFVLIFIGLAKDIYYCDIQKIPNCD